MTTSVRAAAAPGQVGGREPYGLAGTLLVRVQRVEPPEARPALVWGISEDGRKVLFAVDGLKGCELQAALDAEEEPTAIVEPDAILAMDLRPAG